MPFCIALPALMFILQPAELGPGLGLWESIAPALMSAARDSIKVRKCRWFDGSWDVQINPRVTLTFVLHCPKGLD